MIDELRQIAIFAKTVEEGSFRAAGQALRLSPSVVSHHVGQLEQRLGTPLLYRSTRKLSLTADGQKLLTAAHAMLEAAETGLKHISRDGEILSGSLRLTVPALLTRSDLFSHIASFSKDHSEVQLSVDSSDTRRDIIADGYDVAITLGPLKSSSLKARKLFQMKRVLVASPDYAIQHNSPETPADISEWRWLELNPVKHHRTVFYREKERQIVSKRRTQITANNANALVELVSAGAGLALLPRFLTEPYVNEGRLTYVLEEWEVAPMDIFAVWPPNVTTDGIVKKFVQFLSETIPDTDL